MSELGPTLKDPVLPGEGGSDYERYLRTDELLSLQKTSAEWVHRDELLFQTVHQSSELWLKLAVEEVAEATRLSDAGDIGGAVRLLRRAVDCMKIVTDNLDMLEHLPPWEYMEVRKVLGHGSGFDSPGFRAVHHVMKPLEHALQGAVEREGLTFRDLYVRGREHEQLYQLAELVLEWDERVVMWRARHFVVVERIIGGGVVGTQGTPVEVLGRLIHSRAFPELWALRDELTTLAFPTGE